MRKALVGFSAIILAAYFSVPASAAGQGANPAVGAGKGEFIVAAKGKGKHRPAGVRAAKPGLDETVRRIVDEAMSKRPGEWTYMAKRMRPPKSHKWQDRWNDLGSQGWELVGQNENIYIFKRPGKMASAEPMKAPKAKPMKESKPAKAAKPKKAAAEQPMSAPSVGKKPAGRKW